MLGDETKSLNFYEYISTYVRHTHDKICLRTYDVLEGVPVDIDIYILGPSQRKYAASLS